MYIATGFLLSFNISLPYNWNLEKPSHEHLKKFCKNFVKMCAFFPLEE